MTAPSRSICLSGSRAFRQIPRQACVFNAANMTASRRLLVFVAQKPGGHRPGDRSAAGQGLAVERGDDRPRRVERTLDASARKAITRGRRELAVVEQLEQHRPGQLEVGRAELDDRRQPQPRQQVGRLQAPGVGRRARGDQRATPRSRARLRRWNSAASSAPLRSASSINSARASAISAASRASAPRRRRRARSAWRAQIVAEMALARAARADEHQRPGSASPARRRSSSAPRRFPARPESPRARNSARAANRGRAGAAARSRRPRGPASAAIERALEVEADQVAREHARAPRPSAPRSAGR